MVLAASCCRNRAHHAELESSAYPNGIGNETGLVGRYIMDTVGADASGFLPIMQDLPPQNEDGVGGMHMYMPWWNYKQQAANKMPFARGYHIEIGGGRGLPGANAMSNYPTKWLDGGYGVEMKKNLRKLYGAEVHFSGRGEMIPNENSYCTIDPNVVDQWAFPSCASTSNGARMKFCKPSICRRRSRKSFTPWWNRYVEL